MTVQQSKALTNAGAVFGAPLALALLVGCGGTSTQDPGGHGVAGSNTTTGGKSTNAGGRENGGTSGMSVSTEGGGGFVAMGGGGNAGVGNVAGDGGSSAGGGGLSGSAGQGSSGAGQGGTPAAIVGPITAVVKSDGCGVQFAGQVGTAITLQTHGVKDANCADKTGDGKAVCGAWSTPREYYVYLPQNYDPSKPYSLIFQAPGCGGNGSNIFPLKGLADSTIRIGISPGPNSTGHGTNPEQGCFDDKEGDDSIDFVFYQNLYDTLNAQLCFDRRRVFASGRSSGGWLANELGCKYAGDATRPVRGVMVETGGLPTDPKFVPTCTTAPMAGMWVHEVNNTTTPFSGDKVAIARAMAVNHCAPGDTYETAPSFPYTIGGGIPDDVCKSIANCDPLYPLVVCPLPGEGQGSHENIVEPAFAMFIKAFQGPPLHLP